MNCNEINALGPATLLQEFGHKPAYNRGDEFLFHAPYRNDANPSLAINDEKKVWIDMGTGCSGRTVDLLMKLYDTTSVSEVLSRFNKEYKYVPKQKLESELKKKDVKQGVGISLVTKPDGKLHTYYLTEYLKSRGISKCTWDPFLEELKCIGTNKQFRAIGFKNDSDGYEVRTNRLQFCSGKKDIKTFMNSPIELVVFEGFFDFLSFVELGLKKNESVIVLNSTANVHSATSFVKEHFPETRIATYFDRDTAGQKATDIFKNELGAVDESSLYKEVNDLNDYLQSRIQKSRKQTQSLKWGR